MAQERQADQMGIAIYENLKGLMLPRRGSVSDKSDETTLSRVQTAS